MRDVGVVMPLYIQQEDFLRDAIGSVLAQTYVHFRLIIVIDGAPQMLEAVKALTFGDNRVTLLSYPENKGVAHALNTGFDSLFHDEHIRYLTWVSSDNVYHPRFLDILRNTLLQGPPELGIAYSSFQSIDNAGAALHDERLLAGLRQYQSRPKEKLLDSSIIGVSFMYKTEFAKKAGGYAMEPVEDYDYWLRLTEHCEIRYVPVELMNYRVNSPHSVSASLTDPEGHRRWRYAFHLTRYMARCRRNIGFELTVLFPAGIPGTGGAGRLENLYDQSYSNYRLIVLDLSADGRATPELAAVPHPVTEFVHMPGASVQHALMRMLPGIDTSYVLVAGPSPFIAVTDMEYLMENLKVDATGASSNYYTPDHSLIGYRHNQMPADVPALYNELFRSERLAGMLTGMADPAYGR